VKTIFKFLALAAFAYWLIVPALHAEGAAVLSEADRDAVARVEAYLNGIQSLRARFLQVAPDGSLSQGRFFLKRPGRLRFEYDPPTPLLVITDGVWVVFYDKEIDQVSRVPLASTPLAVLVRETVDLSQDIQIDRVERAADGITITISDPEQPDTGSIILYFADKPLRLKRWRLKDAQGQETAIAIHDAERNVALKPELFFFFDKEQQDQNN